MIISKSIILGEWYQPKHIVTGITIREWVRQDVNIPELSPHDLLRISHVPIIHFYPNIIHTLGVSFRGQLRCIKPVFDHLYNTSGRGFMNWDMAEEAKQIIDNFLIKYSRLKAFL